MTDQTPRARRRPVRSVRPAAVYLSATGAFCVALTGLALQLRAGADPALGAGQPAPATQVAAAPATIVRRVEIRRVVTHEAAATRQAVVAAPGANGPAPAVAVAQAPAAAAPAPVPAAAPAPAPAPVPAPAPAVSRAS